MRTRGSRPPGSSSSARRDARPARTSSRPRTPPSDAARDALRRLPWQPYRSRRGDSGVRAFALLDDGIAVEFVGGGIYLYTAASAGAGCLRQMRTAARDGRGLSTLISRTARHRYSARLA